jgi:hypothetical protein
VVTTPPPHGRGSLQFGVGFIDDFEGGSGYQLSVRHQLLPANRRGGEWVNVLQFGTESLAATEFYQPLDSAMRWFVAPSLGIRRSNLDLYLEGEPVAEYRIDNAQIRLAAGRVLGNWGELRATAFVADAQAEPRIGAPVFPSAEERRGGFDLGFRVDTVDEIAFPRHGSVVDVRYTTSSSSLESEVEFDKVWASASHSWSFGELTLTPYLEYGENFEDTLDLLDLFPLGGLFRLSGLGQNELLGERAALATLQAYWRLFGLDLAGLKVRLYTGLSLEAGNVYFEDPITAAASSMGAVWVGAMTLRPARLAYGLAEGGATASISDRRSLLTRAGSTAGHAGTRHKRRGGVVHPALREGSRPRTLLALAGEDLLPLLAELVEDVVDLLARLFRVVLDRHRAGPAPHQLLFLGVIGVDDQRALGVGRGMDRRGGHATAIASPASPVAAVAPVAYARSAVDRVLLRSEVVADVEVRVLRDRAQAARGEPALDGADDAVVHQLVAGDGLLGIDVLEGLDGAEVKLVRVVDVDVLRRHRQGDRKRYHRDSKCSLHLSLRGLFR